MLAFTGAYVYSCYLSSKCTICDYFPNTACPPNDLGTIDNETNSRCAMYGRFDGSVTIANGTGCFNTTVGSVATYMCDEGYTSAHGNDLTRTCLINGSWNGSILKCKG